jgi:cytochrome oxidase Cu insertion factor (SCO1/SenC/PrrC family)
MKSRLTLIALFAVFFAPVVAAVLLHSQWISWQAPPAKAHGELIEPVVPLGTFRLADAAGNETTLDDLTGRWQLVYTTRETCGGACVETLSLMHNIRLAQDRHMDEVGLVVLSQRELDDGTLARLRAMDRGWHLFDGDAGSALLARFPDVQSGAFYIVDPDGNIMERFDPGADLNGVRKDLDRLLTWTVREQQ